MNMHPISPLSHQPTLDLIRQRFERGLPLNLSAVKREAPELLKGLWIPAQFVGWRQMIEAAGLRYDQIRFILEPNAFCPLCEFVGPALTPHISIAHGLSAEELRKVDPGAETRSEELRTVIFDYRHGRKSLTLLPHWERAWSLPYALERVRWMYDLGMPVNYQAIAKGEPGLAAYLRRLLGSWDKALEACGLDPQKVRMAVSAQVFTKEQVVEALQQHVAEDSRLIHIKHSRQTETRALFTAVFREFTSLEAALVAAGIDPFPFVPALNDPVKMQEREELIRLVHERIRAAVKYDAGEVAGFLKKHKQTVRDFWGDWANLAKSIGCLERDIFNPPEFTKYQTRGKIIDAIRERRRLGLSLQDACVRVDNGPLLVQGVKEFGTWGAALNASKVKPVPRMIEQRKYTPKTLIAYLQEQAAAGTVMWSSTFVKRPRGVAVLKWAVRYFGSWQGALAKAGIDSPQQPASRSMHLPKKERRFANDEAILDAIRQRVSEGKSMMQKDVSRKLSDGGDWKLMLSGRAAFGTWPKALVAAGVSAPGERFSRTRFWDQESVIIALKRRHAAGPPFKYDNALESAMKRYFPDRSAAYKAAGLPDV
jgi:hypothetical protein